MRTLRAGGLVAHPTEGVWGLACDPLQPRAVLRLLAAKRRDPDKGFILVADSVAALTPYLAEESSKPLATASADWPGPTTWLLPANPEIPWWLRGAHDSIAVRVSAHPLSAALSHAYGSALVSTSANRSGHVAAKRSWQARDQLGQWLDMLLAGDLQTPGRPSEIRDAASGRTLRSS